MATRIDYYITMVSKIMSLVNAQKSVRPKVLGAKPKQAGKKGGDILCQVFLKICLVAL
jgi:hypothetical protein